MSQQALHPIIYVRGFAMRDAEIEDTVNTPYMGFNVGSTRIRQAPDRSFVRFIFESPLIRLMKEYGYQDVYAGGAEREGSLPRRSIVIHRYYEQDNGEGVRPSIIDAARELGNRVLWLRDRICGDDAQARQDFKVYLVAHSMGGLVCRCLLQNPEVASDQARGCVDKVFTYGTPHNGIEMGGFNVPRFLGLWDISNFNRDNIAKTLALTQRNGRVDHLDGRFPAERFMSLVGTNHRDYNLARFAVGDMSDGLVKIENAYVQGGPRVYCHLSHSGHFGMVNSEEGYQNLTRFLFGNTRVTGKLVLDELPMPPSVDKAYRAGDTVEGSYLFECTVTPRMHPPIALSDRRTEQGSAIFRRFDDMFHPAREGLEHARHPVLFSVFLDTAKIQSGRTMVFVIDLAVRSTEFKVDGHWFLDRRIPDENLYRERLVIQATRNGDEWTLRYVPSDERWGESRGRELGRDAQGAFVPLSSAKGFAARLYLEFAPWH
ncbi:lipase family alpha/beta hydrolase [Halomonas urumqiensis]|uniref:GPI inositol-deacylase PGAP1-like alpha/beta domain-containing protein n=1 Tax=Halomonas urumqiensis TaxID=1684789 RepID=A0A2N7UDD8_9GAMM|nr:hypothetical protein [Halomonas urumqiensis]PMR78464.1 hypothetical protein C1H70_17115 [Halomonas urumqiensis]PTB03609.1 hypothetical protein C6V82_03745 [Halomonas urumqiensis]GHE20183.1 hypothetical protein GCM10017767_07040 [Halomonas urumqiensis]